MCNAIKVQTAASARFAGTGPPTPPRQRHRPPPNDTMCASVRSRNKTTAQSLRSPHTNQNAWALHKPQVAWSARIWVSWSCGQMLCSRHGSLALGRDRERLRRNVSEFCSSARSQQRRQTHERRRVHASSSAICPSSPPAGPAALCALCSAHLLACPALE